MGHRTNAADSLGKMLGIPRIAADQQLLKPPEQGPRGPGIDHLLLALHFIHGNRDLEMSFQTGYGIYKYLGRH